MNPYNEIISAIRGGNPAAALVMIEPLLKASPDEPELLALHGLALAVSGRASDAADALRRAIRHASRPADILKYTGNLARLLAQAGLWQEVAALATPDLPSPARTSDAEFDAGALENLCGALLAAGETGFVARFLAPVLHRPGASWELEHIWLRAADGAELWGEILARTSSATYRWRDKPQSNAFACAAAVRLQKGEEADRLYAAYLETAPPYLSRRKETQLLSIAVISPDPAVNTLNEPAALQHFHANFPSQVSRLRGDRYRFFSILAGSPPRPLDPELGTHAFTLNNCVNGEMLKRGGLAKAEAHEAALGLPVLNPARQAVHCTRQETAELLRGIPGLVIPRIMRFRLEPAILPGLRSRIKDLFGYPAIVRSVGEQEAANLFLAEDDDGLWTALTQLLAMGDKDIYVIEYRAVVHENGLHRRLRVAFAGEDPVLMRADYDARWCVKGRKTESIQAIYRNEQSLREQADAIVRNPAQLGDEAWAALGMIAQRMPLDVFGIDFDVDEQGRVIFFEANATMNLLSTAPPEIDYPAEADQGFLERLDKLFLRSAGVTLQ